MSGQPGAGGSPVARSREDALTRGEAIVRDTMARIPGESRDSVDVGIMDAERPIGRINLLEGRKPRLNVSTGMLTMLDSEELHYALCHEAAHARQGNRLAEALATFTAGGGLDPDAAETTLRRIREADADRNAIKLGADPGAAIRALAKGRQRLVELGEVEHEERPGSSGPKRHPPISERIRHVEQLATNGVSATVPPPALSSIASAHQLVDLGDVRNAQQHLRQALAGALVIGDTAGVRILRAGLGAVERAAGSGAVPKGTPQGADLTKHIRKARDTTLPLSQRGRSAVRAARGLATSDALRARQWYDTAISMAKELAENDPVRWAPTVEVLSHEAAIHRGAGRAVRRGVVPRLTTVTALE